MSDFPWQLPWRASQSSAETAGLQRELEKEVGPSIRCGGRIPGSSRAASIPMMCSFAWLMAGSPRSISSGMDELI